MPKTKWKNLVEGCVLRETDAESWENYPNRSCIQGAREKTRIPVEGRSCATGKARQEWWSEVEERGQNMEQPLEPTEERKTRASVTL